MNEGGSAGFLHVADDAALATLVERLRPAGWFALDTEFLRERTYFPQLCLIQIATPDLQAVVDPLAPGIDLGPLMELLLEPGRLKVFHSARQDLELFLHLAGRLPAPVYDTQIAAALLGHGDQVGYAALVSRYCGVELAKHHTRADWSRRPLSKEELAYAVDDVRYLAQLYPLQRAELEKRGTLQWLERDFDRLADPALYRVEPREMWARVRDAQRLKGRALAVLRELAAWREERAMRLDRPRRWILKDEVLVDIARFQPADRQALSRIRGLEKRQLENLADELLAVVARGLQVPEAEWPRAKRRHKPTAAESALVDAMMALVRLEAERHGISASMIAGRKELEEMVVAGRREVLGGWRELVVGPPLEAFLAGRLRLQVRDGRLEVVEAGEEPTASGR